MAMVTDGKCIVNAKLFLEEGNFLASKMPFSFNKYVMFEISHDSRKTASSIMFSKNKLYNDKPYLFSN